jgi:surface polysaccharide O-acyltransferase-like enzyme
MQLSLIQSLWFFLALTGVISLITALLFKVIRKHNARKPDAMNTLWILQQNNHQTRARKNLTEKKKLIPTL